MWDSVYLCYSEVKCKVLLNRPQCKIGQHDEIIFLGKIILGSFATMDVVVGLVVSIGLFIDIVGTFMGAFNAYEI